MQFLLIEVSHDFQHAPLHRFSLIYILYASNQGMLESRAALPISQLKEDILQLLEDNNVLVVCGETGSGKTTQVNF